VRHRRHGECSIYAPCRVADLERSWQAFKRRIDDPVTRDAAVAVELLRMAEGREPQ
jgi:hypothetical protein